MKTMVNPLEITGYIGNSVQFTCYYMLAMWDHKNGLWSNVERQTNNGEYILIIRNLVFENNGTYQCREIKLKGQESEVILKVIG